MQVITMDDKAKRDEMFARYRAEGEQVTKFSGVRLVMAAATGEIELDNQGRPRYCSTWSIAYPVTLEYVKRSPSVEGPLPSNLKEDSDALD